MYLLIINILCLIDAFIKYNKYYSNINLLMTQLFSLTIYKTNNYGFALSIGHHNQYHYKQSLHIIVLLILTIYGIINKNLYLHATLIASYFNLLDRLLNGYIIDYIKIKIFDIFEMPIFNICDIIIIINIILFINNNGQRYIYS